MKRIVSINSFPVVSLVLNIAFIDTDVNRMSLLFEEANNRKSFSVYLRSKYAKELNIGDTIRVIGVPNDDFSGIKEVFFLEKDNSPLSHRSTVIVGSNSMWEEVHNENLKNGRYLNAKEA